MKKKNIQKNCLTKKLLEKLKIIFQLDEPLKKKNQKMFKPKGILKKIRKYFSNSRALEKNLNKFLSE